MTNIPDANIAAAISDLNQAKALIDQGLAQLAPTGAFWDPTGVVNNPTFSNQDLTVAANAAHLVRASLLFPPSDKFAELDIDVGGQPGYIGAAIIAASQSLANPPTSLAAVPAGVWVWRSDGWRVHNGQSFNDVPTFTTGDKIGILLKANGEIDGYKNGTLVGPLFTGVTGDPGGYTMALAFFGNNGSPKVTGNFTNPLNPPAGSSLYA